MTGRTGNHLARTERAPAAATRARVLVLAPHPDDETFGAGGLIQQAVTAGAALRVVFATDGENNGMQWTFERDSAGWRLVQVLSFRDSG